MSEEKVKRPRGNPNFGKKKTPGVPEALIAGELTLERLENIPMSESAVWLELYCAVINTYSAPGPAVMIDAAKWTDAALKEYQKRYPQ